MNNEFEACYNKDTQQKFSLLQIVVAYPLLCAMRVFGGKQ